MRLTIGGCDGQADTPDPIPNSEVKRPGGENTLTGKIAAAAFFVVM